MTAPHARQPRVLPRPACTPTAIRAVLAANADGISAGSAPGSPRQAPYNPPVVGSATRQGDDTPTSAFPR